LSQINAPSQASGDKEIWSEPCHQDSPAANRDDVLHIFSAIDEAKIVEILARPSLTEVE